MTRTDCSRSIRVRVAQHAVHEVETLGDEARHPGLHVVAPQPAVGCQRDGLVQRVVLGGVGVVEGLGEVEAAAVGGDREVVADGQRAPPAAVAPQLGGVRVVVGMDDRALVAQVRGRHLVDDELDRAVARAPAGTRRPCRRPAPSRRTAGGAEVDVVRVAGRQGDAVRHERRVDQWLDRVGGRVQRPDPPVGAGEQRGPAVREHHGVVEPGQRGRELLQVRREVRGPVDRPDRPLRRPVEPDRPGDPDLRPRADAAHQPGSAPRRASRFGAGFRRTHPADGVVEGLAAADGAASSARRVRGTRRTRRSGRRAAGHRGRSAPASRAAGLANRPRRGGLQQRPRRPKSGHRHAGDGRGLPQELVGGGVVRAEQVALSGTPALGGRQHAAREVATSTQPNPIARAKRILRTPTTRISLFAGAPTGSSGPR